MMTTDFARVQLRLDLRDDVGIELGGLGQQHEVGVGGEGGIQVDGHADHAKVIVEEILAGGVMGLVALDADRLAELAEEGVDLLERGARHARHGGRGPVQRFAEAESDCAILK